MEKRNPTSGRAKQNAAANGNVQATVGNVSRQTADNKTASRNFAFGRINYIMLCASVAIVVIGLVLMSGGSSTPEAYDPEIFNAMHIKVAPIVTFIGFVSVIIAVMYKPKNTGVSQPEK